ncbi:MAG: hypothetical protein WCE68_17430 [Anaerolineales bacterium]
MTDRNGKKDDVVEASRFENVLLCAPSGEEPVSVIPTIKWMETVLVPGKDPQGQETYTPTGFLVTIPPSNALKIYSHVCRDVQTHERALAILEKEKTDKDRTPGKLPVVWNGAYRGCPLCAIAIEKGTEK